MNLQGYTVLGIQKKLNSSCEAKRRKYNSASGKSKYERMYILKPKEQIPDLYDIIAYVNYSEDNDDKVNDKKETHVNEEL